MEKCKGVHGRKKTAQGKTTLHPPTLLHLQPCRQVPRQANTQTKSYTHVTDDDQIPSTSGNIARTNNEVRLHTISENSFFSFKSGQERKTSLIFSQMTLKILHLDSK